MRWLPIAVVVLALAAGTWLVLGVTRTEGDGAHDAARVSGSDRMPADFRSPAAGAAPFLGSPYGDPAPVPLVDERSQIPEYAPTGGFVGRVVRSSGQPLGAARLAALGNVELRHRAIGTVELRRILIGFSSQSAPLAVAVSTADGTFALSRVPAGRPLVLRVDAPGGRLLLRDDLIALADETLDLGDVSVPDGAQVLGLVTDAEGRQLAGVDVMLGVGASLFGEEFRRRGCGPPSRLAESDVRVVQTGSGGNFEFDDVHPVHGEIAVFAPGFAPWSEWLTPKAGERRVIEVQLQRGLRIAGRTVDEQGRPVADAHVTASEDSAGLALACAQSDRLGRFELVDLTPEMHSLRASVRDVSTSEQLDVQAGAEDVVLHLEPVTTYTSLTVEVVDGSGVPAVVFDLWCDFDDEAWPLGSYVDSPEGGVVLSTWRTRASGYLWAQARGVSSVAARLPLQESAHGLVRLELHPTVPVEGRVIDAVTHVGLPGAELHIGILGDIAPRDSTLWTDKDGAFRLEDIPPGPVTLHVSAAGHREAQVGIGEAQPRVLDIPLSGAGTLLLQASAAWRNEFGARTTVTVTDRDRDCVLSHSCSELPCLATSLHAGHYDIEVTTTDDAIQQRSRHLDIEVASTGVTRVDLSSLTFLGDESR